MKIDLHIHTKKVPGKDSFNRDIDANNFCKKMEEANVGIASITNHNFFDFKQYEEIKKTLEEKKQQLLLIPGIEVDLILENYNRKQVNILFSQENMIDFEKFYSFFSNKFKLINDKSQDYKGIPFKEFENYILNECKENEIILYIDSKKIIDKNQKNTTSFSNEEIDGFLERLNKERNICIIRDTNSYDKYELLIYHNKNSLIGTDNLDWNDYLEKSSDLLEYNALIKNFSQLFSVFKNGENYETFEKVKICKIFDSLEIFNKHEKKQDFIIKNLKIIENSMNVIFGPKSSGKTNLLYSIYLKLKNYKSEFYESSDENKFLKEYKTKDYFTDDKEEFKKSFNVLLEYKENEDNYPNFYKWACKESTCFFPIAEIEPKAINVNQKIINDIESAIGHLIKASEKIYNIDALNIDKDLKSLKEITNNIIQIWIKLKKENFIYEINRKISSGLSEIIRLTKDKITRPKNLGLLNKFKSRQNLFYYISELKNYFAKKFDYELNTYNIPSDENKNKEIKLKYSLVFKFNYNKTSKYSVSLDELIRNYCNKKNFFNPNECLKTLREEIIDKRMEHFIVKKDDGNFIFLENNKQIEISKGEKYYLNLMWFLEKDLEYFFLDEPETSLNNNFISKNIYRKFIELVKDHNKTIIITTHNSILGINTKSMNFIFRDNKNIDLNGNYETFIGNIQEKKLWNLNTNEKTNIDISEKLLECFEGDKTKYQYRRKVYEI